jgi:hypothetical protein
VTEFDVNIVPFRTADPEFFKTFLEKYNIKNYTLVKHETHRYVILDNKDNYYYKLSGTAGDVAENDLHYFLNNAYFPNHLVLSIIDTELNIRIIKSSLAPGKSLHDILQAPNNLDNTFIIKMMEWFKWQHTESRRIFPLITNKYFTCTGISNDHRLDLHKKNIIYDEETHRFTPIDFENEKWLTEEKYILYTFNAINEVVTQIKPSYNSNNWPSIRQYPKVLDYCIEYIYKEIL